ncbi:MAG: flagellar FliL protein [Chitinophagales bacterium]|jgi:flagellar FliL protein
MQKLLLSGVLMILLLVGQVAGQAWSATEEEAEEVNTDSAYISLGEPLVLNLSSQRSRNTYLQLTADILIKDADSEALIKTHIPAMRHQLIVLLSEQPEKDMKSPSKREEIRKTATAKIQAIVAELSNNEDIADVLFSSFLVQ